jgi:hypothetical protein
MTRNEWFIFAAVSAAAVVVMVCVWPYPDPYADSGSIERDVLQDFLRGQRAGNPRKWRSNYSETLLRDMEEAAKKMAEQFGPARHEILEAAGKGELPAVEPYDRELPYPDETVTVHMNLEVEGVTTTDREKGRTRVYVAGLESLVFDNAQKTGVDYERLAAVLAALEIRRQSDRGEGVAVLLAPMAFVPFKDVRKAIEAAARAGITDIRLRQSPIPD